MISFSRCATPVRQHAVAGLDQRVSDRAQRVGPAGSRPAGDGAEAGAFEAALVLSGFGEALEEGGEERPYLRPLPSGRVPEYTTFECRVRKWSTIRVGGRVYSVPSRLIGHTVEARQHPSTVEVL